MSVVWATSKSQHVFDAVAAVERSLGEAEAAATVAPEIVNEPLGDHYLAENVTLMRNSWEINPWAVSPCAPTVLGRVCDIGQRVVRRLTWWYSQPQLSQAVTFHASVVRTTDALLAHLQRLSHRIHVLESMHSESRLRTTEEQLRLLRDEHAQLLQRVAQLEVRLARRDQEPAGYEA
ncbi:MAG: hypothetical protein HGA65_10255 [Oscillochloris sp.]|nr:hypothetical protein [Oscillochloris sp.]